MNQEDCSKAAMILAEGILKIRFPEGVPGMDKETSEIYIQQFVSHEISKCDTKKLTFEKLVQLFEKYCEFEQTKSALQ